MVVAVDVLSRDFDGEKVSAVGLSVFDLALMERYPIVGSNSAPTNEHCGKFEAFYICDRVDLHEKIGRILGKDYSNQVFVRRVHNNCGRPLCPACRLNWASVLSHKVEGRLLGGVEVLKGSSPESVEILHIVVSISLKDYGITDEKVLRKKVIDALKVYGVIGSCLIFHGSRKRHYELLKSGAFRQIADNWKPHFHILGMLKGGYKCRGCKNKGSCVVGCDGFDAVQWAYYGKTGIYAKELGKRKTIGGTAYYQLNHSSVNQDGKRAHVITWMGMCGYRKLKVKVEKHEQACPICGYALVRSLYNGCKPLITSKYAFGYVRDSLEDYREGGVVVWSPAPKRWFMRDSVGVEPRYGSMEWLKRAKRRSVISWDDSYGERF